MHASPILWTIIIPSTSETINNLAMQDHQFFSEKIILN